MRYTLSILAAAGLAVSAMAQVNEPAEPQGAAAAQEAAQTRRLFTPAEAMPRAITLPAAVSSANAVNIDLQAALASGVGDRLEIETEPGVVFTAVIERVERRSATQVNIVAGLERVPHGRLILVVEHDVAAMRLLAPTLDVRYSLRSAGPGVHAVCKLDMSKLPDCSETPSPDPNMAPAPNTDSDLIDGMDPAVNELFRDAEDGFDGRGGCVQPESVFDIAIFYTNVARAAAGSTNAIVAEIQAAIVDSNQCYDNSIIRNRMRLVHCVEVTYNEVGTFRNHLDRITDGGDGVLDNIPTIRDAENADCASLFVDDGDAGGIAWCQANTNSAYSIVKWDIAADQVLAHEIGHNQGCAHDRANVDCSGRDAYSFGWRFNGASGTQYRTVMSYAPGQRIQHFSNPNVNFDSRATGQPIGSANQAFNARTIDDNRFNVEGFQLTRYDIWVDFGAGFPLPEIGTFSLPYNTIGEGVTNLSTRGTNASEDPNLYVKQGTTAYTGTITKAMWIRACGGTVTIGQ
jgi:hypothetical protein